MSQSSSNTTSSTDSPKNPATLTNQPSKFVTNLAVPFDLPAASQDSYSPTADTTHLFYPPTSIGSSGLGTSTSQLLGHNLPLSSSSSSSLPPPPPMSSSPGPSSSSTNSTSRKGGRRVPYVAPSSPSHSGGSGTGGAGETISAGSNSFFPPIEPTGSAPNSTSPPIPNTTTTVPVSSSSSSSSSSQSGGSVTDGGDHNGDAVWSSRSSQSDRERDRDRTPSPVRNVNFHLPISSSTSSFSSSSMATSARPNPSSRSHTPTSSMAIAATQIPPPFTNEMDANTLTTTSASSTSTAAASSTSAGTSFIIPPNLPNILQSHLHRADLVTTSTTIQPRFDPSSPQVVSSRPMPKVVHRSTSISTPGGQAPGSGPSSQGNSGPNSKINSPSSTATTLSNVKRSAVPNLAAAVGGSKTALGLESNSNSPTNGDRSAIHSVDIPATPLRGSVMTESLLDQSLGSDGFTGSPKVADESKQDPYLEHLQQVGRSGASPSPNSLSSNSKRQHQSWSLPQRGSVTGQTGFSSSSFRPMLQKELYAAGQMTPQGAPLPSPSQQRELPHRNSYSESSTSSGNPALTTRPAISQSVFSPPPSFGKLASLHESNSPIGERPAPAVEMGEVRLHIGPSSSPSSTFTREKSASVAVHSPVPAQKARERRGSGSTQTQPTRQRSDEPTSPPPMKEFSKEGGGRPPAPRLSRTRGGGLEAFLRAVNSFPTRIPGSKSIALVLFHPMYLAIMLLLSLIGIFALDFNLAFMSASADHGCDILLLFIGATWCLELLILSIVLPGYLLHHFWWYMDVFSIVSLVVDISMLRGLGMNLGPFEQTSDSSFSRTDYFHGLTHGGYAKLWLFLHYGRLVRLFKYWNGLDALAGTISLNAVYMKIGWRSTDAVPHIGPFHKASTLGLHLTNRLQKQLTATFLIIIAIFTLLSPTPAAINNNQECTNGSNFNDFSSMEQWTTSYLDGLYNTAVTAAAAANPTLTGADLTAAVASQSSFVSARSMIDSLKSSYGGQLLYVSLSAPSQASLPPTVFPFGNFGGRSIEAFRYACGGTTIFMSNSQNVHQMACWNILLLVSLLVLYILSQSFAAFAIATTISHPLERMNKIVRKMAGTVLFLQSDLEAEKSDPWEQSQAGAKGRRGAASSSSSSWYLTNRSMPCQTSLLSSWVTPTVPAHYELEILEEVMTKMSSVFNLLPGGLSSLLSDGTGEDKARRMMVGSRRTEIKTRDSILTIDVVERPVAASQQVQSGVPVTVTTTGLVPQQESMTRGQSFRNAQEQRAAGGFTTGSRRNVLATGQNDSHEDEFFSSSTLLNLPNNSKLGLSTMQNPAGRASIHHALPAGSELRFESHPELRSLEDLLSDPFASIHFKQYLHKKFCLETITFYEQVTKYKARMQSWAFRIYHQFVVAGAPHEINIHSAQRQTISAEIFHPSLDIFNLAQKEVYKLMKNNFMEFLVSQACYQYLTAKQHKQLTIKVGEDHI